MTILIAAARRRRSAERRRRPRPGLRQHRRAAGRRRRQRPALRHAERAPRCALPQQRRPRADRRRRAHRRPDGRARAAQHPDRRRRPDLPRRAAAPRPCCPTAPRRARCSATSRWRSCTTSSGARPGSAGALALGYTCSGLYAALTSQADGDYDAASGHLHVASRPAITSKPSRPSSSAERSDVGRDPSIVSPTRARGCRGRARDAVALAGCGDDGDRRAATPTRTAATTPVATVSADRTRRDRHGDHRRSDRRPSRRRPRPARRRPPPTTPAPTALPTVQGGPIAMRRLTTAQYKATIADVLGADIVVAGRIEPDNRRDGLLAVGVSFVSVTGAGFEQYETIARNIAEQALDPAHRGAAGAVHAERRGGARRRLRRRVHPHGRRAAAAPAARRRRRRAARRAGARGGARAGRFLRRARGGADGAAAVAGVPVPRRGGRGRSAGAAAAAPHRCVDGDAAQLPPVEHDARRRAGRGRRSAASWSTTPDWRAQVDRLLESPRLVEAVRAFFSDLYGFDEIEDGLVRKDPTLFPAFSQALINDAREQTLARHRRPPARRRTATIASSSPPASSFMTRALGIVYQVPVRTADGWEPFTFPAGSPRAGLLTHVSLLALRSHPGRSSPTLRGKFVREVLLCTDVPPPPGDIDFSMFARCGRAEPAHGARAPDGARRQRRLRRLPQPDGSDRPRARADGRHRRCIATRRTGRRSIRRASSNGVPIRRRGRARRGAVARSAARPVLRRQPLQVRGRTRHRARRARAGSMPSRRASKPRAIGCATSSARSRSAKRSAPPRARAPPSTPTATPSPAPRRPPTPCPDGRASPTATAGDPGPTRTATPLGNPTVTPAGVTFQQLQDDIFTPRCATQYCHSAQAQSGGMVLEEGAAFGILVGAAADNRGGARRGPAARRSVGAREQLPARQADAADQRHVGSRMPLTGRPLSERRHRARSANGSLAGANP